MMGDGFVEYNIKIDETKKQRALNMVPRETDYERMIDYCYYSGFMDGQKDILDKANKIVELTKVVDNV